MALLRVLGPHRFEPVNGGAGHKLAEDAAGGSSEVSVAPTPFLIGRAPDCQLVLPKNDRLRALTSRWHCHLLEKEGDLLAVDGSFATVEDYGGPKPSATGTLVNGTRISEATPLKDGDVLEVGPWSFEVRLPKKKAVEAVDLFRGRTDGVTRKVEAADPKLREKFGQLHELVHRLSQIPSFEESMMALLSYAVSKIEPAEIAAILSAGPEGWFKVRLGWQRGAGKVKDFSFSESLLRSMPPDQTFLLESRLTDPSLSQNINDISSGLLLPLWGKGERLGVLYMDNRRSGKSFTEEDLYLAAAIASLISLQLSLERQTQLAHIEKNMARYFAPDVVQRIVDQSALNHPIGLDVQERDVTVMFVDMEGFTALSREKTPREISEFLNPFLESIARRIQAGGGHVNKFIGDSVLGIFGAQPVEVGPFDPVRYATQAVRTALDLPVVWDAEVVKRKLPPIRIRIGVNSGRAVVGNIGYPARLEYSVLGDTVNVASRLEKLAPPNRAAISEATRALVEKLFEFEDLGQKEIKGLGLMRLYSPLRTL